MFNIPDDIKLALFKQGLDLSKPDLTEKQVTSAFGNLIDKNKKAIEQAKVKPENVGANLLPNALGQGAIGALQEQQKKLYAAQEQFLKSLNSSSSPNQNLPNQNAEDQSSEKDVNKLREELKRKKDDLAAAEGSLTRAQQRIQHAKQSTNSDMFVAFIFDPLSMFENGEGAFKRVKKYHMEGYDVTRADGVKVHVNGINDLQAIVKRLENELMALDGQATNQADAVVATDDAGNADAAETVLEPVKAIIPDDENEEIIFVDPQDPAMANFSSPTPSKTAYMVRIHSNQPDGPSPQCIEKALSSVPIENPSYFIAKISGEPTNTLSNTANTSGNHNLLEIAAASLKREMIEQQAKQEQSQEQSNDNNNNPMVLNVGIKSR